MVRGFLIVLLSIITTQTIVAQEFTAEEKAYLYHTAFNSPKIAHELNYFFHFENDSLPMINDTLPDYDSIGFYIIENPDKMQWEKRFIGGQKNGLLLELAHKVALRNLNLVSAYNFTMPKAQKEKVKLYEPETYLKFLKENLPTIVYANNQMNSIVKSIVTSSYTNSDRISRLQNTDYPVGTIANILKGINLANEKWMHYETMRIYTLLGGKIDEADTKIYLMAAGDGGGSIDKNNGFQAQMHQPLMQSIYQMINHFGYGITIGKANSKGKTPLYTQTAKYSQGNTYGDNRPTNLHFTVWGYTEDAQTTVAVVKDKKFYLLFGQNYHSYLSVDSAFAGKRTYYSIIDELENEIIADLRYKLYGKKGFEYHINKNKEYAVNLQYKIKNTEYKLNNQRYGGAAVTESEKKKRDKTQAYYIWLNSELDATLKLIKELELAWEEALEKLNYYEAELDKMKQTIGYTWMEYEIEDSIATFSDGTQFNLKTQDFTFQGTTIPEKYEIRLIAVPEAPLLRPTDEVYVSAIQFPTYSLENIVLNSQYSDAFPQHSLTFHDSTLSINDTAIIQQILVNISQIKAVPNIRIVGHGAALRENSSTDYIKNYPGENEEEQKKNRQLPEFKNRRYATLQYNSASNTLEIHAFTDNVLYTGEIPDKLLGTLEGLDDAAKNELYSAAQGLAILNQWYDIMDSYGKNHLNVETYENAMKKLSKAKKKAKALFNLQESISLKEFEKYWQ